MPNDCLCSLDITGPAPDIERFRARLAEHAARAPASTTSTTNGLGIMSFEAFVPIPDPAKWYEFCNTEWGTKWEPYHCVLGAEGAEAYSATFYTAWSPPMEFLCHLSALYPTLKLKISYEEPGMDFAGDAVFAGGKLLYDTPRPCPHDYSDADSDADSEADTQTDSEAGVPAMTAPPCTPALVA